MKQSTRWLVLTVVFFVFVMWGFYKLTQYNSETTQWAGVLMVSTIFTTFCLLVAVRWSEIENK